MNIEKLRTELESDEGNEKCTYTCSQDRVTFGIGHLVLPDDPEYSQPIGTPVSEDRITECFNKDVGTVIAESKKLYPQFDSLPEEVKLIICNMLFNLGLPTLSKFKDSFAALTHLKLKHTNRSLFKPPSIQPQNPDPNFLIGSFSHLCFFPQTTHSPWYFSNICSLLIISFYF